MRNSNNDQYLIDQARNLPLPLNEAQINQMVVGFGQLSLVQSLWYKLLYAPKWSIMLTILISCAGIILLNLPSGHPIENELITENFSSVNLVEPLIVHQTHNDKTAVDRQFTTTLAKATEPRIQTLPKLELLPVYRTVPELTPSIPYYFPVEAGSPSSGKKESSINRKRSLSPSILTGEWSGRVENNEWLVEFNFTEKGEKWKARWQLDGSLPKEGFVSGLTGQVVLQREAGDLILVTSGNGKGTFDFNPNLSYPDYLQHLGMDFDAIPFESLSFKGSTWKRSKNNVIYTNQPDVIVWFRLFLGDVQQNYFELLDQYQVVGNRQDVWKLADQGMNYEYLIKLLSDLELMGIKQVSIDQLLMLKLYKLNPDLIPTLSEAGITKLNINDLIQAAEKGLDPGLIQKLHDLGFKEFTFPDLLDMNQYKDQIDPALIMAIRKINDQKLSPEELFLLQNYRIDFEFVNGLYELGFREVGIKQLIDLNEHHVSPDYIAAKRKEGFDLPDLEAYKRLKITAQNGDLLSQAETVTRYRQVKPFRNLEVSGPLRIVLVERDTPEVIIKGMPEMVDLIRTKTNNNTLKISVRKNFKPGHIYDVYVGVPELKRLVVKSGSVIYVQDQLYIQSKNMWGLVLPLKELEGFQK
ncbi:MAG: DUF2807 domain-containing protein [Lewinella sp.]|nr:DUF2807 domain-containing protein [Lewinella sp.]